MDHNAEVLWVWLKESFRRLGTFTWGTDHLDGTPYTAEHHGDSVDVEWGAVLMGCKMDLEGYVRDLKWHDYNGNNPCGLCGADRGITPWTDFRPDAAWHATILNARSYSREYAGLHPLYGFPGISVHTCFLDVMHVLDYKGITSWVAGGLLWSIISRRELRQRTYEGSLHEINELLTTFYTTNRVQHRL